MIMMAIVVTYRQVVAMLRTVNCQPLPLLMPIPAPPLQPHLAPQQHQAQQNQRQEHPPQPQMQAQQNQRREHPPQPQMQAQPLRRSGRIRRAPKRLAY